MKFGQLGIQLWLSSAELYCMLYDEASKIQFWSYEVINVSVCISKDEESFIYGFSIYIDLSESWVPLNRSKYHFNTRAPEKHPTSQPMEQSLIVQPPLLAFLLGM